MREFLHNESELEHGVDIHSKAVRAGKRTYFFDVKVTRGDDYFIAITESRKKNLPNGAVVYEKQKIHLYKEDFTKFCDAMNEVINFIQSEKPESSEE